jgi:UDPglucose--hexose-1-phosphate uridylyltransferase
LSGRRVVIAPGRALRPGAAGPRIEDETREELATCPFCAGREDRTPPETLVLGDPWQVRVVPNLYPAFARQEVVVHAPRHVRSLAELSDGELGVVADAWRRRREEEPGGYLHALVNEGRAAGASLAHSHSQLVWLETVPPALAGERAEGLAELLDREDLRLAERANVVLLVHGAGAVPYELLLAPREPDGNAFGDRLPDALALLAGAIRRLRGVEGPLPWNAWLHAGPHWHLHVQPRLTTHAGIELGAGLYVNTLPPEEAATRLREAV